MARARMRGKIVRVTAVAEPQRRRMFELFSRYYEDVGYDRFVDDLERKDYVILLFGHDRRIQGFSTMKHLAVRRGARVHRGLFSGDTVVAEAYWGQRVLGRLFLKHLWKQRLKRPLQPYWWFLISKGYKTYLLMANNFAEHYPRFEQPTPDAAQEVLDAFATEMFPRDYDRERGVIAFQESLGHLRGGVAAITADMLDKPRIRFFQRSNPTWRAGTELACIARMTWTMPAYYAVKAVLKKLPGARQPHALHPAARK